jgi:DNA replication protein
MRGFSGFPPKGRLIKIPGLFFTELLPQIDHMAELKVTLYAFWRLQQQEGQLTFLRKRDMLADSDFLAGLGDQPEATLADGLERAVSRGTLLHVQLQNNGRGDDLYFLNTLKGRAAVDGIQAGKWSPDLEAGLPMHIIVDRPNIYRLYEQNIGMLTPLIADRLEDLEQTYPQVWLEEAVSIAVKQNKSNLSYVEAILKRWRSEGRAGDTQSVQTERFSKYSGWDETE